MLLGFQERFAPAVELGLNHRTAAGGAWAKDEHGNDVWNGLRPKRQTIRALRKDGRCAKVGDTLKLYTGLRTKKCRKLGEAVCLESCRIVVMPEGIIVNPEIGGDGSKAYEITGEHLDDFARLDGFQDMKDMWSWIEKTHGQKAFIGQLYRW